MKLKRLGSLGSAFVLSISALLTMGVGTAFAAAPYTCTWTGATNDNFSNAGNWSGCNSAAPQATDNDNLVFDNTNLTTAQTLNNDITGLTVGTLTFSGTSSNYYNFALTGDALTVNGGITQSSNAYTELDLDLTLGASQTITITNGSLYIGDETLATSHTLTLGSNALTVSDTAGCSGLTVTSALSGSGTINDNSSGLTLDTDSPSYTGAINDNSGWLQVNSAQALGTGSAGVTVASGATLSYGTTTNTTFAEPVTVSGTGENNEGAIVSSPQLNANACSGGGGPSSVSTATLSGDVTLTGNTTVGTDTYFDLAITGTLSGNYTLTEAAGSSGSLTVNSSNNTSKTPNSTLTAPAVTTTVAAGDNQPSQTVDVGNNETFIINGIRGDTTVETGGTLKGTGEVGNLYISKGGFVAPGDAPGCITVNGNLTETGTYDAVIQGTTACSGYDQLDVTGTVTLNDGNTPPTVGILQVSLANGFVPKAGQTFEIINNEGSSAVSGTFSGLAEGAEVTVSGVIFKISYVGGTGNDVVLTVVSVPGTPDTGFGLTSFHTEIPMVGGLMIASGLYFISRKIKNPIVTKRR